MISTTDKKAKKKTTSVDLDSIIIREVESLVDMLERDEGRVDRVLLEFLEKHIARYIAMVRMVKKCGDNAQEIVSAKRLSERVAKLMERCEEGIPRDAGGEVVRQVLEGEDAEILNKYLEDLKAENERLQGFIEKEDTESIKRRIAELEKERDELKRSIESMKSGGEHPEVPSRIEEEVARIKSEVEARVKSEYEKLLEDARREAENYKERTRVVGTKFRELQKENASLLSVVTSLQTEVRGWREKFNRWEKTMEELAEKKAQAILFRETKSLTERITQLTHKEKILTAIQNNYEIIMDGKSGTCLVIPKPVSQNLTRVPGSKLKMEIRGTTVTFLKSLD